MINPKDEKAAPSIKVILNGNKLDVDIATNVLEVEVNQHILLPNSFTVHLIDTGASMLDGEKFKIGDLVAFVSQTTDKEPVALLEGEITAIEPEFTAEQQCRLILSGFDKSHRLYRNYQTKAFQNIRDSDIAEEFADALGLEKKITSTEIIYEHLIQSNETDLHFLQQRAARIGFVAYVTDTTLHFHPPTYDEASATLHWGDELVSFFPRLTSSGQVNEIQVRDWDMREQKPILGRADEGDLYAQIGDKRNGSDVTIKFGKQTQICTNHHARSQAEADLMATARLNEISGRFIEAEGRAYRKPEIKAGEVVEIITGSKRFDGKYLVTSAEHRYGQSGFYTRFSISGLAHNLLLSQFNPIEIKDKRNGVVIGVVSNTQDPDKMGRVKVAYPWLSDELESDWCRVISAGAGPASGFCAVPAVDDEVLIAFEHGNFNRPYILGSSWNGKHALPTTNSDIREGDEPLVRSWHSRSGHQITMFETDEKRIDVKTAAGNQLILDDTNKLIEIKTADGLTIKLSDSGRELLIESPGSVQVKGQQEIKIESGGNMTLTASGELTLKGARINLN